MPGGRLALQRLQLFNNMSGDEGAVHVAGLLARAPGMQVRGRCIVHAHTMHPHTANHPALPAAATVWRRLLLLPPPPLPPFPRAPQDLCFASSL